MDYRRSYPVPHLRFGHFFGGMHAIVAFVLGVLLTVIYEWGKTLITPIFVHAGINFVASLGVVFMMVAHAITGDWC